MFSTMTNAAHLCKVAENEPPILLTRSLGPDPAPVPPPSSPPKDDPAPIPKPSPSLSSPLHSPSGNRSQCVPRERHSYTSKAYNVCAVFTHHSRSSDKGCLQWGRVLAVNAPECTVKWQIDKQPSSRSAIVVFATEAAAWAAFDSIPSFDGTPKSLCFLSLKLPTNIPTLNSGG